MKVCLVLPLAIFFSACSSVPTATPAPTVDVGAIQTQAALMVFATQTASIPTATATPTANGTPIAASTPKPTSTQIATATVQPTETPAIPPRGKYMHNYRIDEKYDNIKDLTMVLLYPSDSDVREGVGGLLVGYSYPGTRPSTPSDIYFDFESVRDTWRYLDCHDTALLLDGSTRLRPETVHDGKVESGYVIEHVYTMLSLGDFLRIVKASKVEGSICNDRFTLSAAQMEGLKDVASRMQP